MNVRNNRFDILIEKQEVKPQRRAIPTKEVPPKTTLQTNSNVFKKDVVSLPVHMNEMNFPELCDRKEVSVQKEMSYTTLFKEEEKTEEKEPTDQVYMNGWLFLKRGMKIQKVANMQPIKKSVVKEEKEKEPTVSFKEVFDSIVEKHRRRTNEFIELNDYDTWYKMYQFPDGNKFEDDDDEEDAEEYEEYDSDLSSEECY
jgi:hypothetical protein